MNIWDIDKLVGCWLDYSDNTEHNFNLAIITRAESYGYKSAKPQTMKEVDDEAYYALDYLQSICPHGYWFEVRDNSLWLCEE